MSTDIIGISIAGRCFGSETRLELFPPPAGKKGGKSAPAARVAVLYGRNGSGKTTLARGFRQLAHPADEAHHNESGSGLAARLLARDGDAVAPADCDIRVFDEQYVMDTVQTQATIKPLLLLGHEQVAFGGAYRALVAEQTATEEKLRAVSAELEDCRKSCQRRLEDMQSRLLHSNWVRCEAELTQTTPDPRGDLELLGRLAKAATDTDTHALMLEFAEKRRWFLAVTDDAFDCPELLPVGGAAALERRVLRLTQWAWGNDDAAVSDALSQAQDELAALNSRLAKLDSILLRSSYADLSAWLTTTARDQVGRCRELVQRYRGFCGEGRGGGVAHDNGAKDLRLAPALDELNQSLSKLGELRTVACRDRDDSADLKKELRKLNDQIAGKALAENYVLYQQASQELERLARERQGLETKRLDLRQKEAALPDDVPSPGVGLETLNDSLARVFCSRHRLQLRLQSNHYQLSSNGHEVNPSEISVGERNILALCYFFAELRERLSPEESPPKAQVLAIDDPVSSFDFDNRIGVLVFIRQEIQDAIAHNPLCRVLVLTHDLTTMFYLETLLQKPGEYHAWELAGGKRLPFGRKLGLYTRLLQQTYAFAREKSPGRDAPGLGNGMRRVLEAFLTFNYRVGITGFAQNPGILGEAASQKLRGYWQGVLWAQRLALNTDSHSEEQLRSFNDDALFFDPLTPEAKHKTARSLLCLLYALNARHLTAHLKEVATPEEVKEAIAKWRADMEQEL